MILSFQHTLFLRVTRNSLNGQEGIGVVRIIETPCLSVSGNIGLHGLFGHGRGRKSQYFLVSPVNAKNYTFPNGFLITYV